MIRALKRLVIMVSGGGSTMDAVLKAIAAGGLTGVEVVGVIASRFGIAAIPKAHAAGLVGSQVAVIGPKYLPTEDAYAAVLLDFFRRYNANTVHLMGHIPKIPERVLREFEGDILSQHPGPLDPNAPPGYDFGGRFMHGIRPYAAQLMFARMMDKAGAPVWDKLAEVVTHRVGAELDRGEVVGVRRFAISALDSSEEVQKRGLPHEHALQIEVLQNLANGTLRAVEREAHWLVKPEHRMHLDKAKEMAIKQFPHA